MYSHLHSALDMIFTGFLMSSLSSFPCCPLPYTPIPFMACPTPQRVEVVCARCNMATLHYYLLHFEAHDVQRIGICVFLGQNLEFAIQKGATRHHFFWGGRSVLSTRAPSKSTMGVPTSQPLKLDFFFEQAFHTH